MSDRAPTISGPQGAMIYLAESLAGLKHEQAQTNALLRELIELARLGAASGGDTSADDGGDDAIAGLKSFLVPNNVNGANAPK